MGVFYRSFVLAMLLLMGACSTGSHYTNPQSASVALPFDPGIVRGELDNGFQYWIRSTNVSGSNHTIELRLLVGVGSVDEGDRERGYAHLLEHVVFRAAESTVSLDSLIASAGLRWGADVNAHTFPDHTEYRFSFSAEQIDLVPQALAFSAAILGELNIDNRHVEPEKRIVEAEWRNRRGDDPDQQSAYIKQWYAGTRWLDRPPLGDLADLRQASAGSLQDFWQRYYTPSNARLIVTGKLDPVQLSGWIRQRFGDLPARQTGQRADASQRPERLPISAAVMMDPEAVEPRVSVTINRALQPVTDYASLREMIEERLATRILRRLVAAGIRASNQCTAYSAHASDFPRRWSSIRFRTVPIGNGTFETCASLMQQLLVSADPLLDEYAEGFLERARDDVLSDLESLERQTPSEMASSLSQMALLRTVPMAPRFAHTQAQAILKLADRGRVLDRVDAILREPRFFTAIAPLSHAEQLPTSAALERALQSVQAGTEELILTSNTSRPGAEPSHDGATIIDQQQGDGIWHWTLSNGVRVFFFRSTERKGVVAVKMLDAGGYADVPKGITTEARYLAHYHQSVAFGAMSAARVRDIQDESNLYVDTGVDATTHSLEGIALSDELDSLFSIFKGVVGPLASDTKAWKFKDRVRQWQLADVALPDFAVQSVYWRRLVDDAPTSLTRDKTYSILQSGFSSAHRELFQTAREPVVVIFGDASSREIESLLAETFGKMKAGSERRSRVRYRQRLSASDANRTEIVAGRNPGSFRDTADTHWFHHCTNRDHSYDTFSVGHQVLAEIVSKRLSDRIREQLGLSYSARAGFALTDKYQQVARYNATFITGDSQRQLLLDEIDQILRQLGREAISSSEIEQAVKKIEAQRLLASKYPLQRADQLVQRLAHGYSPVMARELSLDNYRADLQDVVGSLARQCFGRADNDWLAVTRKAVVE